MIDIQKMIAARCKLPTAEQLLPDRSEVISAPNKHKVLPKELSELEKGLVAGNLQQIQFALGCFWGAEKAFWSTRGVLYTAVGYSGGQTKNPSYEDVCSGKTGHTEVVWLVFDPSLITIAELLQIFWQSHDPTQGMRQGNDIGTQYRSAIYYYSGQKSEIEESRALYQSRLNNAEFGEITTEILPAKTFFFAETYHQQYLAKNPNGYCGLGGTGVLFGDES